MRCAADVLGIEIARELLSDRRAALPIADQGVQDARHRAPHVDTVVLIEAVIFRGDQRIDHVGESDLTGPIRGSSASTWRDACHRLKSRRWVGRSWPFGCWIYSV